MPETSSRFLALVQIAVGKQLLISIPSASPLFANRG